MLWQNAGAEFDPEVAGQLTWAQSNHNFGVWARFAYALNAETEYVCVFDDDTIAGSKWIENCLNTIEEYNGLLGTNGVIFNDLEYQNYTQHGWAKPNEKTEQVDIVGHSWFFKKQFIHHMWRESAPTFENGEDMHISAASKIHGNIQTIMPQQINNDRSDWGDTKPEKGWDEHASWRKKGHGEERDNLFKNWIKKNGVFIIAELSANHNGDIQVAIDTVKAAKKAGADAIKLQTYTPDTMTLNVKRDEFMLHDTIWKGQYLYDLYQTAYTPWDWHAQIFDEAKKLFEKEKYDDSKFLFQRDIVFNPKKAGSYLYLAKIFKIEENLKEEEKNLMTTLLLDPKNEEAIYLLMNIEIERSNFAKVKDLKKNFEKVCSKLCPKISSINEKLKNFDTKNES